MQILKDENRVGNMTDKVVVITGCSSGIGIETLRAMHATGATCFATARSLEKLHPIVEEIKTSAPEDKAPIYEILMDQESLDSVRKAGAEILEKCGGKVNILINNAGVMDTPEGKTKDGWETQFGVNHLSHFLLFQILKPALLASSTKEFNSRVVNVSSYGHRGGPVRLNDHNFEKEPYNGWAGYGQSKTANIWMATEISRRYGPKGLWGYSLHPGGIWTGLQKGWDRDQFNHPEITRYMKNVEQGAANTVYAAVTHDYEGKSSKWLSNCEEWGLVGQEGVDLGGGNRMGDDGHAEHAFDEAGEKQLWADSCKFVGVENDA